MGLAATTLHHPPLDMATEQQAGGAKNLPIYSRGFVIFPLAVGQQLISPTKYLKPQTFQRLAVFN